MRLLTAGSWKRRSTSLLVTLTILASMLPLVTAQLALANGLSVQVTTWQVDTDTGVATYDLTVSAIGADAPGAPCSVRTGRCKYKIEAVYRDETGDTIQKLIASNYAGGTFSVPITGSVTVGETTHLKATLYDVYGTEGIETWEQWMGVSDPYPDGSISVDVSKWNVNPDNGAVDYDVTMRIKGAGQMNAPCQNTRCYYGVQAYYKDGSTEKLQQTLYQYDCLSGCWTVTKQITTATAGITKEVTHLRAYVYPSSSSCPAPCSKESWETWLAISAPYPDGSITLTVDKWQRDPASSYVDYDLTMKIVGARQENGPCIGRCYYRIEAWYADEFSQTLKRTLYNYDCLSGCWTVAKHLTATAVSMVGVTHLRAHVYPSSSSCAAPCSRESYDTGLIFVGDDVLKGEDVVPHQELLGAALVANPSTFCDPILLRGGPSTDGDSLPDAYQRCLALVAAGVTIYVLVREVLLSPGGLDALEALVEDWVSGDPIPQPKDEENLPLPWVPDENWPDNGCNQFISDSSIETAAGKIESNHLWGAKKGKSEFYENVDWRWLAKYDAKRVAAEPSSWTGSPYCVRRLTYWRHVGFERYRSRDVGPTEVYTVLTFKESGGLFNMYPGEPAELQN